MGRAGSVKIRKGDTVEVLSGKDRGKRGTVERVLVAERKVIVEGVNVAKRHMRPRPSMTANANAQQTAEQRGGVIEKAVPIDISNVALVSPGSGKATRVGFRVEPDGRKVRVSRRDSIDLDDTKITKAK